MKVKHLKTLSSVIFVSLSLIFSGCINLAGNDSNNEQPAVKEKTVKIQVSVDEYKSLARTILPLPEDGTDIEKFQLEGIHVKNSMGETLAGDVKQLGEWRSYSELSRAILEVLPGTWKFTLNCYKSEGGVQKLFASGQINNKQLTFTDEGEAPVVLDFSVDYSSNALTTGKCSIKVNVPAGQLNHAKVSIYKYVSGVKNQVTLSKTSYTAKPMGAAGYESFAITEANIPNDYYFVEIEFYTDAGATPTATRVEYMKIAGGQTSATELTYNEINLRYTVTYHPQLPDGEPVTMPSDFTYNNSTVVTLQPAVADHYNFLGWYETSDYTGTPLTNWTAGDRTDAVNLYAKWDAKTYPVTYYDFAGGQATGKAYSGTPMASSLTYGITIPEPTYDTANGALSDGNEVVFAGWYTDKDCTAENKITTYNSAADLYAKWNYKYVYLDPSETTNPGYDPLLGNDANRGYLPTEPLYTMEAAKLYMKGNIIGEKVYLMSRLSIAEEGSPGASGINAHLAKNNPSELTTPAYNNAILQRYNTYNAIHDSLVRIDGGNIVLSNVTIDGGAVWGASGPAGVNSGIKSDYAVLDDYGNYDSTLLLSGNVVIQNGDTSESPYSDSYLGGGLRVSTSTLLTIDSKNVIIKNNKSQFGAGISLQSYAIKSATVDILKLNYGIIENNYATKNGGGICICYINTYFSNTDKMNVYIGTADGNSDGSDVVIRNNVAAGNGGGIFATYHTNVYINNVQITENSSISGAGIYAAAVTETGYTPSVITVFNAFIERNTASQNGGGLYVEYNTNGCAKYSQDFGSISYNNAVNGGGVATDATDTSVPELSDLVIKNNTASSNGGGVYVKTGRFIQLEDVIVSKNKCSASGYGAGIYSDGTVKLGGEIDVSDNYRENSAVQNNIFINNNSAARYIKLISPISPASGKTKVATIDMTADKYPTKSYDASDSSTYVQILTEDSGTGYIASSYKLFGVEKTGYEINELGRIKFDPLSAINAVFDFNLPTYTATELTFTVEPSVSAGTLTATAAGGYTTYHWIFDSEILAPNTATLSLNVSSKPAGYYDLLVIAKNNDSDVAVATKTVHIVKELNAGGVVPLENLSAYLATLPAGEHNISMVADFSVGDNVQAFVTALKDHPNVIVNLDLRGASFTEFAQTPSWYNLNYGYPSYFASVTNLKSIIIPSTVSIIGREIFLSAKSLTSITIPDSVKSIGDSAFRDCTNLTSITIPDSVKSIGDLAFRGCTNLTSVTIPNSVTSIGDYTFNSCKNLTSITIPSSVRSVGMYSFEYCSGLTSVTIPDSVKSIGNSAFSHCTKLTSVTIPNSVTSIGDFAFSFCNMLSSIIIPDSVKTIGRSVFDNCRSMTSVIIPNSVTEIYSSAFYACTALTSITIPVSVRTIGKDAFTACSNLTSVTFEDAPSNWTDDQGGIYTFSSDAEANANYIRQKNYSFGWTKN